MAIIKGLHTLARVGAEDLGECQDWSLSLAAEETDTSIINRLSKRTTTGAVEGTGSFTCYFDDSDTQGQEVLEAALFDGSTVSLELYTDQNVTGTKFYSFDAVITQIEVTPGGATGYVGRTISFKAISVVTPSTVV